MVVFEKGSLKLLLLHQTESLIKLMSLVKQVETAQMKKQAIKESENCNEEDMDVEEFENMKGSILERALETHVASYRLAVERLQNKINDEIKKVNPEEENLVQEKFNWDQLDLETNVKEIEIKEQIDSKLDMISSFFYDLTQSTATIPLSVGILKKRVKSDNEEEGMEGSENNEANSPEKQEINNFQVTEVRKKFKF